MPINWWTDLKNVVHPHSWNATTCAWKWKKERSSSQKASHRMTPCLWNVQDRQIHRDGKELMVASTDCWQIWGFFLEWWKCSKIRLWWWLYNSVSILKSPGLCALKGYILWQIYVSCLSIQLLSHKKSKSCSYLLGHTRAAGVYPGLGWELGLPAEQDGCRMSVSVDPGGSLAELVLVGSPLWLSRGTENAFILPRFSLSSHLLFPPPVRTITIQLWV